MRKHISICFLIGLMFLASCDKREDFIRGFNTRPIIKDSKDVAIISLLDSVKIDGSKDFTINVFDPDNQEITVSVSLDGTADAQMVDARTIRIVGNSLGISVGNIILNDGLERTSIPFRVVVFNNLAPKIRVRRLEGRNFFIEAEDDGFVKSLLQSEQLGGDRFDILEWPGSGTFFISEKIKEIAVVDNEDVISNIINLDNL